MTYDEGYDGIVIFILQGAIVFLFSAANFESNSEISTLTVFVLNLAILFLGILHGAFSGWVFKLNKENKGIIN